MYRILDSIRVSAGHAGLMDEAEVEEVIHLVERQKKRLHFADSLIHVQPAVKELHQLPLLHGLSDQDLAKVRANSDSEPS